MAFEGKLPQVELEVLLPLEGGKRPRAVRVNGRRQEVVEVATGLAGVRVKPAHRMEVEFEF